MDEITGRGSGLPRSSSRRALILGGVAAAGGAALIGRLYDLQIVGGGEYTGQAEANRTRQEAVAPLRGLLFDRNGTRLVRNLPIFNVWALPGDVPEDRIVGVAMMVAELTDGDAADLQTLLTISQSRPLDAIRLARDIPAKRR